MKFLSLCTKRRALAGSLKRNLGGLDKLTAKLCCVCPSPAAVQSLNELPLRIIDEIWSNLRKEIDFRQEARNIRRFAAAFADWPTIAIPDVINGLVSKVVIVQERSGGRRIDDPAISGGEMDRAEFRRGQRGTGRSG